MNRKNIIPHQNQPIERISTGQLFNELAELSEEILQGNSNDSGVQASLQSVGPVPACLSGIWCSFDGEDIG
ncbi:DUF5837 family cyanobactin class RiPP [Anabaena azotica]|uniref:Microcyclamide/patellamide family RiPP n=1 Tax=Anabaena azotica FACHB-119 TaxID=947527 RepID=A0ABR8DE78_9NOST|nr:DUF5837 family cyanobactin class RiPP [Anabaena azotica]MBD2504680.1 microcyclamide/patellamide family RiPP [Anabaena azotica FACHB-119]